MSEDPRIAIYNNKFGVSLALAGYLVSGEGLSDVLRAIVVSKIEVGPIQERLAKLGEALATIGKPIEVSNE